MDHQIGTRLCDSLQPPGEMAMRTEVRSLLFIRPGGLGDAVLLIPVIKALRRAYPECNVDVLAERRNAAIFDLAPGIRTVFLYDTLVGLFSVLRNRYDVVIDTEQWYRLSAVVSRLVRAPVKIGFGTNNRRRMFTHCEQYDPDSCEPDNFFSLLKPLGIDCQRDGGSAPLEVPLQSVARADQLLQSVGSDQFVIIFPGASIPEKRWGGERFSCVARKLIKDGYRIVVVGGKEELADGDAIVAAGGLNLAGKTTLAETAAVIARATFVLSGDSGVLHIAAGLDIPTVSLFGPSSASKWAPRGDNHIVVSHHLLCSPCSQFGTIPECPIAARCITDITVDEVMVAIGRLSAQPPASMS